MSAMTFLKIQRIGDAGSPLLLVTDYITEVTLTENEDVLIRMADGRVHIASYNSLIFADGSIHKQLPRTRNQS